MKTKIVCIDCVEKHIIPTSDAVVHWSGSLRCDRCKKLVAVHDLRKASDKMEVKLTYFKPNGKFYATGSFEVSEGKLIHEIFDLVAEKAVAQKLPGFNEGHGEFIVLVDVPQHPHNHPALINTESVLMQPKKPSVFRQGW